MSFPMKVVLIGNSRKSEILQYYGDVYRSDITFIAVADLAFKVMNIGGNLFNFQVWQLSEDPDFKIFFKFLIFQNLAWSNVKGFVDNLENPDVIMFLCQQWACYLAGNSKAENLKEFLVKIPEKVFIYVPSQEWELSLKTQWTYFGYSPRTELSAKNLSLQSIRRFLNSLPEGFQMKGVDVEAAKQILSQNFSDHWVGVINFFGSSKKFVKEGVGFCIQEGEKIVSIVMGFKASVPITQSIELA